MNDELTVTGRVVRVERLKTVTFAWCWRPPDVIQCVLPASLEPRPTLGAYVTFTGALRPYGGHRTDCYPMELAVRRLEILGVPELQRQGQGVAGLDRARFTFGRCLAIAEAQRLLTDEGLIRVDLPVVVGAEAEGGGTSPFRLIHGDEHAFLTVNSLAGHHEYIAAGCPSVFQLSRLYWQHRSSSRAYLTEINLVEFSLAGAGRGQLITMAERVMERIRERLVDTFGEMARVTAPLSGLPQLHFAEAAAHAAKSGVVLRTPHVLPRRAVSAIAASLGAPAFWLLGPPEETTPYYVRTVLGGEPRVSQAADLYLPDVGEAASGSEWVTDPAQVTRTVGEPGTEAYLAAVSQGIPEGSGGLSLGLDRLLMFLLGQQGSQDNPALRAAPPIASRDTILVEPHRLGRRQAAEIADADARMTRALSWLDGQGFRPCMTNLLAEPWLRSLAVDPPVVDYFGRAIALAPTRHPQHHRLLAECPMSVYELGPVSGDGPDFSMPPWTLDVSVIRPDLADLEELTETLIRLLSMPGEPELIREPMGPRLPGYFADRADGHGLKATQWAIGGRPVAWAGLWPQHVSDLPHALGSACGADLSGLTEFLAAGAPPAGGLTIDVGALPALNWPRFAMRIRARAPAQPS